MVVPIGYVIYIYYIHHWKNPLCLPSYVCFLICFQVHSSRMLVGQIGTAVTIWSTTYFSIQWYHITHKEHLWHQIILATTYCQSILTPRSCTFQRFHPTVCSTDHTSKRSSAWSQMKGSWSQSRTDCYPVCALSSERIRVYVHLKKNGKWVGKEACSCKRFYQSKPKGKGITFKSYWWWFDHSHRMSKLQSWDFGTGIRISASSNRTQSKSSFVTLSGFSRAVGLTSNSAAARTAPQLKVLLSRVPFWQPCTCLLRVL